MHLRDACARLSSPALIEPLRDEVRDTSPAGAAALDPDPGAAKEVFVTNAVRGIRPVASLGDLAWSDFTLARRVAAELGL